MLSRRAPAKLNLYLHLTGKRSDGYHTLESLVTFTDLADVVSAVPAESLSLAVRGPFAAHAGAGEENLVLRAARALQQAAGISAGAALQLEKHIPVGAGLGGGSADAAATLQLLNELWRCRLSLAELAKIGETLGADVPMCVYGTPALARGIGEQLEDVSPPLPKLHAVLVYPNAPLATPMVYETYQQLTKDSSPRQRGEKSNAVLKNHLKNPDSMMDYLNLTHNDLQRAAIALMPEVAEILLALETSSHTQFARMTGSGSCCFALMQDRESADALGAQLTRDYPNWWVKSVTSTG